MVYGRRVSDLILWCHLAALWGASTMTWMQISQRFFTELGADFGEGPNFKKLPEEHGWVKKAGAEVYLGDVKDLGFGSLSAPEAES